MSSIEWEMTQRREIEYCRPPPQRSTPTTDTTTTADAHPLEHGHVYPEDVTMKDTSTATSSKTTRSL